MLSSSCFGFFTLLCVFNSGFHNPSSLFGLAPNSPFLFWFHLSSSWLVGFHLLFIFGSLCFFSFLSCSFWFPARFPVSVFFKFLSVQFAAQPSSSQIVSLGFSPGWFVLCYSLSSCLFLFGSLLLLFLSLFSVCFL